MTRLDELDAPPTGDGNNTGSFVCRPTIGQTTFSQHAYGLAVDLNPFQNPYLKDDLVLPELSSAYLDRDDRKGVIHDDAVVRAVRRDRLGVGRRLADAEGLPALQRERNVSKRSEPREGEARTDQPAASEVSEATEAQRWRAERARARDRCGAHDGTAKLRAAKQAVRRAAPGEVGGGRVA